jgi:aminoglycoside N3'-acetyltransferase
MGPAPRQDCGAAGGRPENELEFEVRAGAPAQADEERLEGEGEGEGEGDFWGRERMPEHRMGIDEILRRIAAEAFKAPLMDLSRRLWEIERPFGFAAFERSGRFCFEQLQKDHLDEVELLEFPADGRTDYWDKRMPIAWDARGGRLEVTSPRRAFRDPVIADWARSPFHLAMWCASTPEGGIETEIVTEGMMRAGESVEGRLVLAEPHRFPKAIFRAVCEAGGAGIVSDFVRDPFATPDGLFWVNSFGETDEWYPGAESRELLGFCVTPRVGRRLRELLAGGSVRAHAEVDAHKGAGRLLAATGAILGAERPDEEVWLAAHLYEPLGGDNSPGAASAMTAAGLLARLIQRGELPPPRRSIRAAMTLELYGMTAVLKTLHERGRKLAATFVLDGPAFRQDLTKQPMHLFLSPAVNPLFSERAVKRAAELCLEPSSEVWRLLNPGQAPGERVRYDFGPGYLGNDAFLGDPMAGGPSFHFHAPEGPYWHNSENAFDVIWPEQHAAMTALHAGLAYYLASLGPADGDALLEVVEEENRQYLAEAYLQHRERGGRRGELARALEFRVEMAGKRLRNLKAWTGAPVSDAVGRARAFADELVSRAAGEAAAGPEPEVEPQPSKVDRRARTAVFLRRFPTFPMSQAFEPDPRERRELSGGLDTVLALMDGQKDLLRIFEEAEYFGGRPLDRRGLLGDCLWLAEHGYLDVKLSEVVTRDELVRGLRDSGVREGDLILAHSSLSAFGHVEGGAETFVDALLEAVGPRGTVLAPTFTHGAVTSVGMLRHTLTVDPYHPRLTRLWTGAVPRAFLGRKGVVRSRHPTHSVAGLGPLAEECLKDQRLDDPPAGRTSAWAALARLGGKIVYAGAPLASSTFLHYLETVLEVPYLVDSVCAVRRDDGGTDLVTVRQHVPGHREFYSSDWRTTKAFRALLAAGLRLGTAQVGLGEIVTVDAAEFERIGLEVLRADPALLLCDRQECLFCRQARRHAR